MKLVSIASGILSLALTAQAQATFFETRLDQYLRKQPVIADVTATKTTAGNTETFQGHFWRSSKGTTRGDNGNGLTQLRDMHNEVIATLDNRRMTAFVFTGFSKYPSTQMTFLPPRPVLRDTKSAVPYDGKYKKAGKTSLEGHPATIWRHIEPAHRAVYGSKSSSRIQGPTSEIHYELWTLDDLQLVVYYHVTSRGRDLEERFENIRVEEPPVDVFQIPAGYVRSSQFFDRHPTPNPLSPQDWLK